MSTDQVLVSLGTTRREAQPRETAVSVRDSLNILNSNEIGTDDDRELMIPAELSGGVLLQISLGTLHIPTDRCTLTGNNLEIDSEHIKSLNQ